MVCVIDCAGCNLDQLIPPPRSVHRVSIRIRSNPSHNHPTHPGHTRPRAYMYTCLLHGHPLTPPPPNPLHSRAYTYLPASPPHPPHPFLLLQKL
jgi:hypothetical protein